MIAAFKFETLKVWIVLAALVTLLVGYVHVAVQQVISKTLTTRRFSLPKTLLLPCLPASQLWQLSQPECRLISPVALHPS
ncbi:MAG: hypothetical protein A2722_00860 [Candidatus Doudnabacteria bacterium RIFCSPHIGHO2_01_FULL_50_11]|uniref:Uncharacterized protein n=1 Tax=Candidatus Doudnabacteria bacterium RIFCSPHIGHO2_01_FULL_50_11 TaxID=1817828 RepID=A0A1F5PFJ4_9BACT|nr:MAG: hypothetical protein A2722_00860 [Candidatus Doudnabacteria bacterium RIFCSPHIGHO2_01_FULL_50_11]HLC44576.1 hypothetical protein [Patescibacteria group bacterium]